MTDYREQALIFNCAGEQLVGVVSLPTQPEDNSREAPSTGLIIIVGGPQYRAGSHRQFVLLARAVAASGTPVLRFDYRGMGDSTGELNSFENVNDDIAAAIVALQTAAPTIKKIALWGLCDGASAALLYCHATKDPRVAGLCLLNPWVRSEASLAKTQVKHYYTQRLRQKEFWLKLLRGGVATQAMTSLLQNLRVAFARQDQSVIYSPNEGVGGSRLSPRIKEAPFQQRMAMAWHWFPGPILLILSGEDYTAKEFQEYASADRVWKDYSGHAKLTRHDLPNVDHTFSGAASHQKAERITLNWMSEQSLP